MKSKEEIFDLLESNNQLNEMVGDAYATHFDLNIGNIVFGNPWPNPMCIKELDITSKMIRKKYPDYMDQDKVYKMLHECKEQLQTEEQKLIDDFEKELTNLSKKYKKIIDAKMKEMK